jgi:NodT family efflux transporter outer membrane factor (OMF) lipoprotein
MTHRTLTQFAAASAIALLAAGCAVGPDFKRPEAPKVADYTAKPASGVIAPPDGSAGAPQRLAPGADIPAQWWTLFRSPALNRLVERALRANPDLAAAQASLRRAQETYYAAQGAYFPQVNSGASAGKQRFSGAQFGQPNPGSVFTLYNASVSVAYSVDVFGGVRRAVEAAGAAAELAGFELEGAYLALTSNVVTTAVQEASLRAQVAATREIVDVETQVLETLQHQFEVGAASMASVLAQKTQLAQTSATLPQLEKQLALLQNQLATLAGDFPAEHQAEAFELEALALPEELPVSLPSKLVEQRPDIRASEAALHAASAEIGIATANMLPQFNLTGGAGSVATKANKLFTRGTGIWNVGANVTQPLFRGGALLHSRRAAIAAYDAAEAQYRATVLAAFQDVANVLDALQQDASALKAQLVASQSAAASLDMARKQYQAGAANYLTLLNALQAFEQTRIALAQARAARYADSAALFQSLGGGWWARATADGKQNGGGDG